MGDSIQASFLTLIHFLPTLMHACLNISEILSTIFELAYKDSPGRPNMHTLASLAITCQWFREPAVSILWRSLPNLTPLVKCLPSDAWMVKEGQIITLVSFVFCIPKSNIFPSVSVVHSMAKNSIIVTPLAADVISRTFTHNHTHTHILVVRRGHGYLYKSLWRRHTNRLWLCVHGRLVTSPASGVRRMLVIYGMSGTFPEDTETEQNSRYMMP